MKILVDTNIVLDFLLEREPFFQSAERLFQAINDEQIAEYVTATTITNIFYIARRNTRSIEQARQAVSETLTVMIICPVNRAILESAFTSSLNDFEDAVQMACAVDQRLDAIVTRDRRDFLKSPISVLSIADLFRR